MFSDSAKRWFSIAHATAVATAVAVGIYIFVPPFAPVFASFGPDIPMSARVLMATYPFAFVLPVTAMASGLLVDRRSRWRWLFVPSAYVLSIAVICFVVWAVYAPVFELSESQ